MAKKIIEIKRRHTLAQCSSFFVQKSSQRYLLLLKKTTTRFWPLNQARKEARSWRGRPRKKRKGVEDRCVHDTKNGLEQWLTVGVAHKLGPIKERRMEEAARSKTCT